MKIVKVSICKSSNISGTRLDHLFDAKTGYGCTANSAEVQYRGFTLYMRPSEFLNLADKISSSADTSFYEQLLSNDKPLGYPTLDISMNMTKKGVYINWKVVGHEGRHRIMAIQKKYGDNVLVPVHMIPQSYFRNRHITPEILELPIVGQSDSSYSRKKWFMNTPNIDVNSKSFNYGTRSLSKEYPRHPAELASPRFQSDMNMVHSPCNLVKDNLNQDDLSEVLKDVPQEMHVYNNQSVAPKGTRLMRGVN